MDLPHILCYLFNHIGHYVCHLLFDPILLIFILLLCSSSYMPLSGFHGVIFWLLGWHQANYSRSRASFPQDKSEGLIFYPCSVTFNSLLFSDNGFMVILLIWHTSISVQWLPSIALLCSIATSFWTLEATSYSFLICLRYWQRKPETKHKGDPSEDFAFSTFFPRVFKARYGFSLPVIYYDELQGSGNLFKQLLFIFIFFAT